MLAYRYCLPLFTRRFIQAQIKKHQSSASLAFTRWIYRGPVNSPHKWPVTRKMFPYDDVIMSYIISFFNHATVWKVINKVCAFQSYFALWKVTDWLDVQFQFCVRVKNNIIGDTRMSLMSLQVVYRTEGTDQVIALVSMSTAKCYLRSRGQHRLKDPNGLWRHAWAIMNL